MTTTESADIFICMDVLSIGKGDLKLTWDRDNAEDVEKAQQTIERMLREGYSIFVETDDGPSRVKAFNPKRMTYIVSEIPPPESNELAAAPPPPPALPPGPAKAEAPVKKAPGRPKGSKSRVRDKEVPVAGSRATAVGRTAGG